MSSSSSTKTDSKVVQGQEESQAKGYCSSWSVCVGVEAGEGRGRQGWVILSYLLGGDEMGHTCCLNFSRDDNGQILRDEASTLLL